MKITEQRLSYGTLFIVEIESYRAHPDITKWLKQNDIQHIYKHTSVLMDYYFIRDEAGIMAFKLMWL